MQRISIGRVLRQAAGAALVTAALALMFFGTATNAEARVFVGFGFGVPAFFAPPVYVPPPIVYPAPAVYVPPPVVGAPPPPAVYVPPPPPTRHYRRPVRHRTCRCY